MDAAVAGIVGAAVGSILSLVGVAVQSRRARRNLAAEIALGQRLKLAEFRQEWIHRIRDAMAAFQSYGVTPDLRHRAQQEMYEHGSKIELFMNKNDEDYDELVSCMYRFLNAETEAEKYACNPQYIEVCQRILKREWEVLKAEIRSIEIS